MKNMSFFLKNTESNLFSSGYCYNEEYQDMSDKINNSEGFFSKIALNKDIVLVSFLVGAILGAGTVYLFNIFGPPTYTLCQRAGFPPKCRIGNGCFTGETQVNSGLTLAQCRNQGGNP